MTDIAASQAAPLSRNTNLHDEDAGRHPHVRGQNVADAERWISMLAGGGLVAFGLARARLGGILSALAGAALLERGLTGHCRLYEALGHNTAVEHHDFGVRARQGRKVVRSVHIHHDRHELYDFWRRLENLPRVMRHLVSVTPTSETGSHWVARGPLNKELAWDAEIINDRPGEIIAWQSRPGSDVDTAGSVRFDVPASGEGTVLTVTLKYDPPGGKAIAQLAHLLGQGLEQELDEVLRTFKQVMETGDRPTASPQPSGRGMV
ncbi:MAG TPA: SRPBCC family protein [Planctomycetaceae bacterium]|nr:SRPBCC family protein [Planctomycetaceae bacterium]